MTLTFNWLPTNGSGDGTGRSNFNISGLNQLGVGAGSWQHLCYTITTGGLHTVYLNNVSILSQTVTNMAVTGFGTPNATNNYAGSSNSGFVFRNEILLGAIVSPSTNNRLFYDDFAIYNRVLSADERTTLFNGSMIV